MWQDRELTFISQQLFSKKYIFTERDHGHTSIPGGIKSINRNKPNQGREKNIYNALNF